MNSRRSHQSGPVAKTPSSQPPRAPAGASPLRDLLLKRRDELIAELDEVNAKLTELDPLEAAFKAGSEWIRSQS